MILRVIVSALQVIESCFRVIIVSTIPERVDLGQITLCGDDLAPRGVDVLCLRDTAFVNDLDNVTLQIDTVVFFQITDPQLYTYGIENPMVAIENLSATTLRNIIGDLELDQCLTSRDIINSKMRSILDEATDPWGIKVNRVELKNILPPKEIQNAMEKQMKAERERREAILRAEGEKKSAILTAEGEKESAILRADAKKQQQILEAEGEAEAILKVQTATAEGIRRINEAAPSEAVLKLKSLEAFAAAANGRATKIIIPSEIQGVAALAAGLIETVREPEKPATKKTEAPKS